MLDPTELLARLRSDASDGPRAKLAQLLVDDVLAHPVADIADPAFVARAARDIVSALVGSDGAEQAVVARAEQVLAEMDAVKGAVGPLFPPALREGARALALLPMTPKHDAVMRVLDREPLRQLLRAQIMDTLVQFGRRAASPVADSPLAKGLGGLGKLATGLASSSPLGRVASAVSGEVERQVEKRASDFADTAVAGVLEGIATQISDPARAKEQAALRVAILDGLLELAGTDYAELGRGHVPAQVATGRKALAAWAADPKMVDQVREAVEQAVAREAGKTVGQVLGELAVRDAVAEHARALVDRELARFFGTPGFLAWWTALIA